MANFIGLKSNKNMRTYNSYVKNLVNEVTLYFLYLWTEYFILEHVIK